jgi:hypothetical protein
MGDDLMSQASKGWLLPQFAWSYVWAADLPIRQPAKAAD